MLRESAQVIVESVDVPVGHQTEHCLVAVVPLGWVLFEDRLVELVEDSELKTVLLEERSDVLNGQSILGALLGFPKVVSIGARSMTLGFLSALRRLSRQKS